MKIDSKKKSMARKMLDGKGKWESAEYVGNTTHRLNKHSKQKGRESLEIPFSKTGKNEGNKMMEGRNEHNRS